MLQPRLNMQQGCSIRSVVEQWIAHNRRFTARTQQHYHMVIKRFAASLAVGSVDKLSRVDIEIYINDLLSRASNRTGNAHLTVLKSFCRWLSENYNVPNHAEGIAMLKEDPPEARYLTRKEYLKVIEANPHFDFIKFIGNTGLRSSEVVNLTADCMDGKLLKVKGKGRKLRYAPLNNTAKQTFYSTIHLIKSRQQLYSLCKKAAQRADVRKFGPHALRHYFCTELLRRGVPISQVASAMGHSSVRTTEKLYYHFQNSFLEGITDCLD